MNCSAMTWLKPKPYAELIVEIEERDPIPFLKKIFIDPHEAWKLHRERRLALKAKFRKQGRSK